MLMISATDLPSPAKLEDVCGDQHKGFRMIELQAAGEPPSRDLTGEDDELVDFAWCQVHGQTAPG
jgi:hypothetical protein